MNIIKKHRIPIDNNGNHENLSVSYQNQETYKNHIIPQENH